MWDPVARLDATINAWMSLHRSPATTAFFRFMTFVGAPAGMSILGVVAILWLIYARHHRQAVTVSAGLLGGWLANELLKAIFHRARPPQPWLTAATGYSFPSGHAMVSMAFLLVLAGCLAEGRPSDRRTGLVGGAVLVSGLIGASRVYLGVHYASDVIIGFLAGAAWAWACLWWMAKRGRPALR